MERRYTFRRIDGTVSANQRSSLVNGLNKRSSDVFVFLLSAKAGGVGLNLIGANRLILFDPDWNPAVDAQAAARVWRDGQKRKVFIYRLFLTGTIEEKILQPQISKHGLQDAVTSNPESSKFSRGELKDLFPGKLTRDTVSDTHDKVCRCETCKAAMASEDADDDDIFDDLEDLDDDVDDSADDDDASEEQPQVGEPQEVELKDWAHHHSCESTGDALLRICGGSTVSMVFACLCNGQEPKLRSFRDP